MKTTSIIILLFWVICYDGYSQNSWSATGLGRSVTSVGVPASGKDSNSLIHSPTVMFAGTSYGEVMMQSDTSSTWTIVANSFRSIYCMAADTLRGVNYLGSQTGLYRSMDGGRNWSRIGFPDFHVWDIEVIPSTGVVYVVVYQSGMNLDIGIHMSYNLGSTWYDFSTGFICWDIFIRKDNSILAARQNGVFIFYPGIGTGLGFPIDQFYCVAEHPDGHVFVGSFEGLLRKDNLTSQIVNVLPRTTISAMVECIYVAKNGYIYAGTSGRGVYYSTDTGLSWQPFINGMAADEEVNNLKSNPAGYLFANGARYKRVYETIYPVEPPQTAKLLSPNDDTRRKAGFDHSNRSVNVHGFLNALVCPS